MKKIILLLVGIMILAGFVSASDVAYIVISPFEENPQFISILGELNLTYTKILASGVGSVNFSDYKFILVNSAIFSNPDSIPVNDYPTIMVDGDNMEDWGWTLKVTKAKQSIPFHLNLTDLSHPIAKGFSYKDITAYTNVNSYLYYLKEANIFDGLTIVASTATNAGDAVIAVSRAGTDLTKIDPITLDNYTTEINANSVFFGIPTTQYWTEDTKKLFKNAIGYVLGAATFEVNFEFGDNLISIPIILKSSDINQITSNSNVVYVKEYTSNIVDTSSIANNKGYFVKTTGATSITIEGTNPKPQTVALKMGMNLVGLTSLSNRTITSLNLPSQVVEISKRNVDGSYTLATKYGSSWYNPSGFELEPGKGYWFKLNGDATWTYSP